MSCTDFEKMVTDLAGDRLMDAMSRRRLQVHADECPACAGRLDNERLLTARLLTLAEQTENEQADPALKTELLAAFTKLHATENRFVVHEAPRTTHRYWLLAAAAALVVALAGTAVFFRRPSTPAELVSTVATPAVQPSPALTPSATPSTLVESTKPAETGTAIGAPQTQTARRMRPATKNSRSTEIASVAREETTTDYLPLTYTGDQSSLQSGVVVRVEIPRSTLLAMGLPMNSDRGNTLVKADVVVGDDGVPRAIRLVQ